MQRHLRMGAWTGFLAGIVSAVTVGIVDLAAGGGLDGVGRVAAALGLDAGVPGAVAALFVGVPLVIVALGLVLAVLPLRVSGAAAGLGLGLLVGLAVAARLASALAPAGAGLAIAAALAGAWAGLLSGFLYSRYARTLRRRPGERPFSRR